MSTPSVLRRLRDHRLGQLLDAPQLPERGPLPDDLLERLAADLLDRFRARDDREAFAFLVELTQPRLSAIARQITRAQASFLAPEELVAAFLSGLFTDVRPGQARVQRFLSLAYWVMVCEARTQFRGNQRRQRRQERFGRAHRLTLRPRDPAQVVAQREVLGGLRRQGTLLLSVVCQCFERLPERDRRVLSLRELDGLSYDDLAVRMDVSRKQIGMVLKRARERLARAIEGTMESLGQAPGPGPGPRGSPRPIHQPRRHRNPSARSACP